MRTIDIPSDAHSLQPLLDQARREDLLLRLADGSEFYLSAVDEADQEIVQTRHHAKLMKFLEQRSQQPATISLDRVKQELGLDDAGDE